MPGPQPSSTTHQATVTLDNDQVLQLPSTPVEVVAAPGTGRILLPLTALLFADFSAGAYTNLDAPSQVTPNLQLLWDPATIGAPATNPTNPQATSFFDATISFTQLDVDNYTQTQGLDPFLAGTQGVVHTVAFEDIRNKNLGLTASNFAGNFTGGDAANSLKVSLLYLILNTLTGEFE